MLIRGSGGGEGWREALEISKEGGVGASVGGVRVEDSWGLGGSLRSQRVDSSLLEGEKQEESLTLAAAERDFERVR